MIDQSHSHPSPIDLTERILLSPAELSEAMLELDALRQAQRGDADDNLTVLRIAHLERLIASAAVVEAVGTDGVAGLGSFVRARDETGRECDYELVGRRG